LCRRITRWDDHQKLPVIETKEIIVGQDVYPRLPELLSAYGKPSGKMLVLMDSTVMYRQGRDLKRDIINLLSNAGYDVQELVLEGDSFGVVHTDFEQVELVMKALSEDTAMLIIGTGVVTDIGKHACFMYAQQPQCTPVLLFSCMTACSVPAYTSHTANVATHGVKRSYHTRTPDCILVDLQTLIDAPDELTIGGAGDTFPVFCAFADWYLAEVFGYSQIVDGAWRIYDDIRELFIPYIGEIAKRSSVGMEVLAKCIQNVGLAMTYADDTVSASGFDHVISHMLDMAADKDGRQVGIHGQQVGLGVLLTLLNIEKLAEKLDQIYEGAMALDIDNCFPDEESAKAAVSSAFNELGQAQADECWGDYKQKWSRWSANQAKLIDFIKDWPQHKANIQIFTPYTAKQCVQALQVIGHPLALGELSFPIGESRGRWALLNANKMRKRFTSGDLAYFLGWLDDDWVEDIFARLQKIVQDVRNE